MIDAKKEIAMDNTYNIFTVERRIDIKKECIRILKTCKDKRFFYPIDTFEYNFNRLFFNDSYIDMEYASKFIKFNLFTIFNNIIETWKYRNSATNIREYFEDLGIQDFYNPLDDYQSILILLTITNLLDYGKTYLTNIFLSDPDDDPYDFEPRLGLLTNLYDNSTKIIRQNIDYAIEQINYKISDYGEGRKIFTKRDEDVDSVLGIDIKLDQYLLGYLDIQNQDNIQFKKDALKAIADYLEPHKQEFKETSMSSYYDTFAFAVNNMNIRHNNKSQINLGSSEKEVYDKIFRIGIHLIRELNVREIKKEIDQYKPQ